MVLSALALPLSVSAQPAEEDSLSSWQVEAKPAPEEPALKLRVDDAGVEVVPSPPRSADGHTLEEMELRVKRARIGLITSAGVVVVGSVLIGVSPSDCEYSLVGPDEGSCKDWGFAVVFTGAVLVAGGIVGLAASGGMMAARKQKLRRLQQPHYGTPHRVQWDLARSRLVF